MQRLASAGVRVVPAVIATDLEDDKPWYAIRWFAEGSLEQMVGRGEGPLPANKVVPLLLTLASGLADVHVCGIAHRDLKPANVLIDGESLFLVDFGLCLDLDTPERLTATEEAVGSRGYIAPENEAGMNDEVDQRPADFYAFGKMIWALLTGRPPLPREQVTNPENTLTRLLADGGLAPVDSLIRDLVARDPRARLHDWEVVLRELAAAQRAVLGATTDSRLPPIRTDILTIARRLREVPAVTDSRERREDADRYRSWLSTLTRRMQTTAREIEIPVADLVEALGGVLTITATSGSAASAEIVRAFPDRLPAVGLAPIGESLNASTILLVHSQHAIEAFPTVAIRISLVQDEQGQLYFVSVPTITEGGEPERAAVEIGRWFYEITGPYPPLRQATIDDAASFVRTVAGRFLAFVEEYVVLLERGLNPANAEVWTEVELQPRRSDEMPTAMGDVTPPDLRSFDLSPEVVRPGTTGAAVICRARIVDDFAGVATNSPSQARLVSPGGQFVDAIFNDQTRISGDSLDGVYEAQLVFSAAAERGRWEMAYVVTVDEVGNARQYDTAELRTLGFATVVRVQ